MPAHEVPTTQAELGSQGRVFDQRLQRLNEAVRVAGADQEAGFIVETDLARAVAIVGDDRFGGGKPSRKER